MRKSLIIILCLTLLSSLNSKVMASNDGETNEQKSLITVMGELNSADAWRVEAGYHWFPKPYIGFGGSLGVWNQFSTNDIPKGQNWIIDDDYREASSLFVHPSLVLFSPSIIHGNDFDIQLYGEVGAMMNLPYEKVCIDICHNPYYIPDEYEYISNNKGDWCFFDGKIGVSARFNNVVLAAGYSYSTLDVYGMRRKLKYDNQKFSAFYPQRHDTHGAFLSISLFI